MTFPNRVGVLTPELVCFHEAGHIATAIMIGASVKAVELFPRPPPYAKTSVERTDPQALFIACGGFAAEYHLFKTGRLVDGQGRTADPGLFLAEAQANAAEDVQTFDRALTRLGQASATPMEDLMGTAMAKVCAHLDFRRVEAIAEALLAHRSLDETQIQHYGGSSPAPWRAAYALARMNGKGRLKSLVVALK